MTRNNYKNTNDSDDEDLQKELTDAIKKNQDKIVDDLLKKNVKPSVDDLKIAVVKYVCSKEKDIKIVKKLTDHGAAPNRRVCVWSMTGKNDENYELMDHFIKENIWPEYENQEEDIKKLPERENYKSMKLLYNIGKIDIVCMKPEDVDKMLNS